MIPATRRSWAAGSLLLSLLIGPLSVATESAAAETSADLTWIAGDWVGGDDDSYIQEQWSAAEGKSMMGMFRLIQGGKVAFYEFMTITWDLSGTVLRIKHFDADLVGWEEKGDSIAFALVEVDSQRAVFETEKDGDPERLVFERHQDELVITLEKPAEGTRTPFRYRLQKP